MAATYNLNHVVYFFNAYSTHMENDAPEAQRPRRYAKGIERRHAIIDAASKLFGERGYRAVSLREIAAASGTTHSTLIHHFGSKDELLQEVITRRDEEVATQVSALTPGEIADALMAATRRNSSEAGIVASFATAAAEATDPDHPAHQHYKERYSKARKSLSDSLVQANVDLAGGISAGQAAALLFAVEDGLQIQWLLTPDEIDILELTDRFIQLLFGPRAERSEPDSR
ncbi:MAG: helix-turn-helix domain-containing protein [Microbacterium sp.]|uniref:TetR/AcrR family transcriptional regulator n=1 Tax=Microbacterium sp. TaxID=51671 RepID=UPI0039E4A988